MSKDAYYFPHDSNAKDDPKCMLLIDDLGLEGYGIYWVLIELLRDQPNYTYGLVYIKSIARKYNTTEIKVKQVITGYGLFEYDDTTFYSLSLIKRMEKVDNLRKTRSKAGKKGNEIRWNKKSQSDIKLIAEVSQIDCKKSQIKEKEIKEKEIKEKEIKEKNDIESPQSKDLTVIKTLFNNTCKSLPSVTYITKTREKILNEWLKNHTVNFEEFFMKVEKSNFLTGRNGKWQGCSFDWIIDPDHRQKIIEGNYDNKIKKTNVTFAN